METATLPRAFVFAGFPLKSWAYAIRIWVAVVLALYVGFWLELEAPSTAAVTVAILALPTRGQGLEKAAFRLVATVLGVCASIAIVGMFTQSGGLIFVALAAWIGLCVYVVGLLDGNRAYAASLGVTTVAIVAVQQIDTPGQVFDVGMARGAAIAVGIPAITVINDVLAAPDSHPRITAELQSLHRRVRDYARDVIRGRAFSAAAAASLLRETVALRPEIRSLAAESSSGPARSAAARATMVSLVAELSAARALASLPVTAAPVMRQAALERLAGGWLASGEFDHRADLMAQSLDQLTDEVLRTDRDVRQNLAALQAGRYPLKRWRAPLYRSRRIAAESGIRAAVYFALASLVFAVAGWPSAVASLSFVAILIGLSAPAPDVWAFSRLAVIVAPGACVLAGLLELVVLDGATGFPILVIALAPFIIGCALLMTLASPVLSSVGRLNMVFIIALVAPSNPQTYNPETFLFACLFVCLATWLMFGFQFVLPPMSRDRQLTQLLAEARRALGRPQWRWRRDLAPEEALFRNAMRVGQIVALNGPGSRPRAVEEAMTYFDQAAALRSCGAALDRLAYGPLADAAAAARLSLNARDPQSMMASASSLLDAASRLRLPDPPACTALVRAAATLAPAAPDIASLKRRDQ